MVCADYGGESRKFYLPNPGWQKAASQLRLTRRAARLDKCNVFPVFEIGELVRLVVIRQGSVYTIAFDSGATARVLELKNCRNVLHQSICRTPKGHIYFGEYGRNEGMSQVPVYRSRDGGRSWEVAHLFPAGSIRHVHGCYWDPFAESIWIATGDGRGEAYLVSTDEDMQELDFYGDGSQDYRTIYPMFHEDAVVWGMDTDLATPYLCRLERGSRTAERLQQFPGPVWYVKELQDGWRLLSTATEARKRSSDGRAHVFASNNGLEWQEVLIADHDGLPKKLFKSGVVSFSDGPQSRSEFYMSGEAIRGMDGRSFRCNLTGRAEVVGAQPATVSSSVSRRPAGMVVRRPQS